MIELRLRSRTSPEELEQKVGKILTEDDFNVMPTRAARVLKPDGSPLLVYLPGALDHEMLAAMYPVLHSLKDYETNNRGLAAGTPRFKHFAEGRRTYAKAVPSAIIGAFDAKAPKLYCRLTAWTGRETQAFVSLYPLFQAIAGHFATQVPARYAAQMEQVRRTQPDWVIPGTPFTTITVNNTYPTGVHTDKGDLDQGFSTLATIRRGSYRGGVLVFPEFRVGVDMKDGDVLLMDAHEWHGNTQMELLSEDAERISIVSYYRTKMAECGTAEQEAERAAARAARIIEEQAVEALGGEAA